MLSLFASVPRMFYTTTRNDSFDSIIIVQTSILESFIENFTLPIHTSYTEMIFFIFLHSNVTQGALFQFIVIRINNNTKRKIYPHE